MPLSAIGGAPILNSAKTIRMLRKGCANRPFYHIVVMGTRRSRRTYPIIEQLGTLDKLPNERGEMLCSLNLERISYWLGARATTSINMAKLLGYAGYYPIHYDSYVKAWKERAKERNAAMEELQQEKQVQAN